MRFIVQQVLNSSVNFLDSIFVAKSWFGGQRVSDFSDHEDLLFGQLIEEAHSQQALRATAVPGPFIARQQPVLCKVWHRE